MLEVCITPNEAQTHSRNKPKVIRVIEMVETARIKMNAFDTSHSKPAAFKAALQCFALG